MLTDKNIINKIMSDKLKEIRDKKSVADFVAGFISGVGEAQDIQDFGLLAAKSL